MPSNESIKDYNVYEQLGQGGFAQVYRAQVKESSKEVAIKMVSLFNLNFLFLLGDFILRKDAISIIQLEENVSIWERVNIRIESFP